MFGVRRDEMGWRIKGHFRTFQIDSRETNCRSKPNAQCSMHNAQWPNAQWPNAQCSMLNAQCPMRNGPMAQWPNAQCPMPNAQCSMLNAQWPNAQCSMAQCPMPNAQCSMLNAQCSMAQWPNGPMPNAQCSMLNAVRRHRVSIRDRLQPTDGYLVAAPRWARYDAGGPQDRSEV